ncbi:PcfJ domain-containing protein [Collimonas sp. OK607]|uniref:PcfJ domain-containing protein n=1 Tax=Collimonas sp. OK607 TaxID=1798194 RepID=UPI00352B905C
MCRRRCIPIAKNSPDPLGGVDSGRILRPSAESVPLTPASVISDQADGIDAWPLVLDETFFYGQTQIVELKNPISLLVEGKLMEHCVGGYSENCRAGSSLVFSVRTCTGSRLSTVELHLSSFPLGVELRSHKAKRNACPQMECEAAVTALIHVLNSANFVDRLEKRKTFQQNQLFTQAGPSRPKPSVLRRYELLTQTLAWRCAFRSEPSQEFPKLA